MDRSRLGGHSEKAVSYRLSVFRIEVSKSHIVRMLSNTYNGLFTHYTRGGSEYCPGEHCGCHLRKLDRLWKGYVAAEVYDQAVNKWAPIVLEITENLELDFRGRYDRGQVWELSRAPKVNGKNQPVKGKLLEERDPNTFPPPFDVKPVLLHVFHVTEIALCWPNPMPSRIVVSHSEGAPPAILSASTPAEKPVTAEQMQALRDRIGGRNGAAEKNGSHKE